MFLVELEPLVLTIQTVKRQAFEWSKLEDLAPRETYFVNCFVLLAHL